MCIRFQLMGEQFECHQSLTVNPKGFQFGNTNGSVQFEKRSQFPKGRLRCQFILFQQSDLMFDGVIHDESGLRKVGQKGTDEFGRASDKDFPIGFLGELRPVLFPNRLGDRFFQVGVGTQMRTKSQQGNHTIKILEELIRVGELTELSRLESTLHIRTEFSDHGNGIFVTSDHQKGNSGMIGQAYAGRKDGMDHLRKRLGLIDRCLFFIGSQLRFGKLHYQSIFHDGCHGL
mmetsp:Transcript_94805/g.265473  ORF Transcript_94805/g.265473 Transcript_94805/m.265473 type:complete len:231 (-) Transcript_94805:768-1460(-)